MNVAGLPEAFAERIARRVFDDRNVIAYLQHEFGDVDISVKQIKAYVYGAKQGAYCSYNEALSLFSPALTALQRIADVLDAATQTIEDLNALSVLQEALDIFHRERTEQVSRHTAIYAVRVSQKRGVAEKFFLEGAEPTEDEFGDMGAFSLANHAPLIALLSTYGEEATRKIMEQGSRAEIAPLPAPVVVEMHEFVRFLIESAKIDYSKALEEAAGAYEPPASQQINSAMDDFMSRMTKGTGDGDVSQG